MQSSWLKLFTPPPTSSDKKEGFPFSYAGLHLYVDFLPECTLRNENEFDKSMDKLDIDKQPQWLDFYQDALWIPKTFKYYQYVLFY